MLGSNLFHARKNAGLTQEEVAERLGVSRQSKRLATAYGATFDELISFDLDVAQVEEAIERTSDEVTEKVDWTSAWAKRYPILARYQGEVNVPLYARRIHQMLDELKAEHGYSELDAMLALKDILYQAWKQAKAAGVR